MIAFSLFLEIADPEFIWYSNFILHKYYYMYSWQSALEEFLTEWDNKEFISGILVAGSTIAGTSNKYSDLDVQIILKKGIQWRERGDRVIQNIHIEYFANPVEKLESYMLEDEKQKKITARMFAMGTILQDKEGYVQYLKTLAERILLEPMPAMSTNEQLFVRHVLWGQLDDMRILFQKNDDTLHLVYYIALHKILTIYAQFLQIELPAPTKLSRYFTDEHWSILYRMPSFPDSKFMNIFLEAVKEVHIRHIEELTAYVLEKLGSFEINGFLERGELV